MPVLDIFLSERPFLMSIQHSSSAFTSSVGKLKVVLVFSCCMEVGFSGFMEVLLSGVVALWLSGLSICSVPSVSGVACLILLPLVICVDQ